MERPIVGLSHSYFIEEGKYMRFSVPREYIDAILRAGGTPIVLTMSEDEEIIMQQMSLVDGFLLIGGCDVNPVYYHEDPHPLLQTTYLARDQYEHLLLKARDRYHKPTLGVCRGIQMINAYYGGTLYQDNSLKEGTFKHSQSEETNGASHWINIEEESFLYPILGKKAFVNSFHHQSCHDIADGFNVVARANDGIVEAIQHQKEAIYAVQFHPEMMAKDHALMQGIFDWFVSTLSVKKNAMNLGPK